MKIRQWQQHSNAQTIDQDTPLSCNRRKAGEFGTKVVVAEQDKIGWYTLLLGCVSTKWMDAQEKYLESIGKWTTGKWWNIAIISKLWDIV